MDRPHISSLAPCAGASLWLGGVPGAPDDFALWRLRVDTLCFRPEAWGHVERLKAACAAELRALRAENARNIAVYAS